MNEYLNMRDIGKMFGLSSHAVGKELRDCGYRDHTRKPTRKAFGEGMVREHWDGEHPEWVAYVWNVRKVAELLEDFGHKKVVNDDAAK
jgi:hypothetical protein